MRSQEEEIYISLVVVKRQSRAGQDALDPAVWANAVLESLQADGGEHQVYTIAKADPFHSGMADPARTRFARPLAPVKLATETKKISRVGRIVTAVCLLLGIACLLSAAYVGLLLVRH